MGKHAIIIIKNEKDEYLQYFDEKWNSYLFMNCKMKNKDDVDAVNSELKQSLGLNKEDVNLFFVGEKVHRKFSESAKIEKEYQHYFYKIDMLKSIDKFNHKEFENSNKRYKWFSVDELTKDERIQKVNSDIVEYVVVETERNYKENL